MISGCWAKFLRSLLLAKSTKDDVIWAMRSFTYLLENKKKVTDQAKFKVKLLVKWAELETHWFDASELRIPYAERTSVWANERWKEVTSFQETDYEWTKLITMKALGNYTWLTPFSKNKLLSLAKAFARLRQESWTFCTKSKLLETTGISSSSRIIYQWTGFFQKIKMN